MTLQRSDEHKMLCLPVIALYRATASRCGVPKRARLAWIHL